MTTIESVPTNKIEFPSITIDAGHVLNPWGFTEKVLDHVVFAKKEDLFAFKTQPSAFR